MDVFGIKLNTTLNQTKSNTLREINSVHSKVKILVIPTNEELEIAKQAYSLISV
jgi:acetate kinase